MKTYSVKLKDTEDPKWHIVDAKGLVLGRTASIVATLLLGKHKSIYAPYANIGDYVVVINAEHIRVTGNKSADKMYYRHSGKVGEMKKTSFDKLLAKSAEKLFKITVKGMLPRNPRGRSMLKKLKVYPNAEHPHTSQQPSKLEIKL